MDSRWRENWISSRRRSLSSGHDQHQFIYDPTSLHSPANLRRSRIETGDNTEAGRLSHQQDVRKWTRYNSQEIGFIGAPKSFAGKLTSLVRSNSDFRNMKDEEDYNQYIGWGDFNSRPRKQQRLEWIDKHLQPAQNFIESNKQYIQNEDWTTYQHLCTEARANKDRAINGLENCRYQSERLYRDYVEQIMGMANHFEWNKYIDEEKTRIARLIGTEHQASWTEAQRGLYKELVAEGQREIERYRAVPERKREYGIADPYIMDIQVAFNLVKNNEWKYTIKQIGLRIIRIKKQTKDLLRFFKENENQKFEAEGWAQINNWLQEQVKNSYNLIREDSALKDFSPENGRKTYNDLQNTAIRLRDMRDVLDRYFNNQIDKTKALGQIDALIRQE